MSFSKNKIWIAMAVIIALTVILAALSAKGINPISQVVNQVITPVESQTLKVITPLKKVFSYVGKMQEYEAENQRLKKENIKLTSELKDISLYKEENERLRKLLEINDNYEYDTVAARVVSYETDNWFSYITIDKGTSNGIDISDTVVTADGLLGQVTDVGKNWAKISTVINSESSAGVRITRTGEIGILEGDTALSKSRKSKLGFLMANASIIAGDILETSGLGGIYPPGILIGKVSEISKDNMGRLDYAIIEPFVNFDKLYEVLVITDWSVEESVAVPEQTPPPVQEQPAEAVTEISDDSLEE